MKEGLQVADGGEGSVGVARTRWPRAWGQLTKSQEFGTF